MTTQALPGGELELIGGQRLERLAEYHVLALYDRKRMVRYGDMAATRRARELNRLGDELIDAGVRVDRTGHFPPVSDEALRAAFDRVARPRIRRVMREEYRHGTKYTGETIKAWREVARELKADWGAR